MIIHLISESFTTRPCGLGIKSFQKKYGMESMAPLEGWPLKPWMRPPSDLMDKAAVNLRAAKDWLPDTRQNWWVSLVNIANFQCGFFGVMQTPYFSARWIVGKQLPRSSHLSQQEMSYIVFSPTGIFPIRSLRMRLCLREEKTQTRLIQKEYGK